MSRFITWPEAPSKGFATLSYVPKLLTKLTKWDRNYVEITSSSFGNNLNILINSRNK